MEALVVAIAMATAALGCAYYLGKDTARTEEQKIVAAVLARFYTEEGEVKNFVSRLLGNLKNDYTKAFSAIRAEAQYVENKLKGIEKAL